MANWSRQRLKSGLKTVLIYGLLIIVGGFIGNLWMSRDQASGKAPVIQGQSLDGEWQSINPVNEEGPVLLYFFAEWCPICSVQHDVISSLSEQYPVIAIAMQSGNLEQVKNYVEQKQLGFPVINDHDGRISRLYGVNGVPASFIIDRKGAIQFSTRGYATQAGLLARLWFAQLESYWR